MAPVNLVEPDEINQTFCELLTYFPLMPLRSNEIFAWDDSIKQSVNDTWLAAVHNHKAEACVYVLAVTSFSNLFATVTASKWLF